MHAAVQRISRPEYGKFTILSEHGTVINVWNMADWLNADQATSGRHVYVKVREGTYCAQSHSNPNFRSMQNGFAWIPTGIMGVEFVKAVQMRSSGKFRSGLRSDKARR